MEKEPFYALIDNIIVLDSATQQELKTIVEEYPYFQTARLLYTKSLFTTDQKTYEEELNKTAVFCTDRRKLFYLIREEEYRLFLNDLHKVSDKPDRTQALLDSFLTSLNETKLPPADTNPHLHIVSADYLTYLDSIGGNMETNPVEVAPMKHQDIIDNFIEKATSDKVFAPSETEEISNPQTNDNENNNNLFLTETLAKIYIKQKKYEQALTIIKRLNLNFPKKSVYFADQIRFLEYLILNEKNKTNKTII
jgi:tetratricopeptide (TPR) repeat protein